MGERLCRSPNKRQDGSPGARICTMPRGHGGPWHDDGRVCWPSGEARLAIEDDGWATVYSTGGVA